MRRVHLLTLALVATTACQGKPLGHPSRQQGRSHSPEQHTRRDLELGDEQAAALAALAAEADAHPDDFAARKASGLAHMRFTLAGVLRLRDRAEADLEAAFALKSDDPELDRSLARFYNMRAVAGDYAKADMQVKVYAALLGKQEPLAMSHGDFVAWSFFQLGRILADKNRGHNLDALAKVRELEQILATRVAQHPDEIELRALAGNFAFFFAGNIPLDRMRRVEQAVAYFEVLRARWDEMRPGARDPNHCPNTRENFMFELAEGYLVLEQSASAREIYEELATIQGPRTRAKELVAHVSQERLRNLERYRGDMKLMPPWPSDVGNCVVCHAYNAEVPLDSLYSLEPIRLADVPSQADYKPLTGLLPAEPDVPPRIADRERMPSAVAEVLERRCAPCHFPGGEVADMLDLSAAGAASQARPWILERTSAGDMPPDAPLPAEELEILKGWVPAP